MNIGKTISNLRKIKQLSQVEFAKEVGITQTSLSQIESGKKRPNSTTLGNICKALNVTELHIYLLSFDENDVPKDKQGLYRDLEGPLKQLVSKLLPSSIQF